MFAVKMTVKCQDTTIWLWHSIFWQVQHHLTIGHNQAPDKVLKHDDKVVTSWEIKIEPDRKCCAGDWPYHFNFWNFRVTTNHRSFQSLSTIMYVDIYLAKVPLPPSNNHAFNYDSSPSTVRNEKKYACKSYYLLQDLLSLQCFVAFTPNFKWTLPFWYWPLKNQISFWKFQSVWIVIHLAQSFSR